jgi:mRNA degradation ribonuclease J1/J2
MKINIEDLKRFIVKGNDGVKLMISSITNIQFEEQLKSIKRHNGE